MIRIEHLIAALERVRADRFARLANATGITDYASYQKEVGFLQGLDRARQVIEHEISESARDANER